MVGKGIQSVAVSRGSHVSCVREVYSDREALKAAVATAHEDPVHAEISEVD